MKSSIIGNSDSDCFVAVAVTKGDLGPVSCSITTIKPAIKK